MEKLYLPTSTLNFNNIFSTESISPAAFYYKRNFGYRRFECIEPNPFKNSLLLFNKYPIFVISDTERINYPMVIEIPIEMLKEKASLIKKADDVNIYQVLETIYLNPMEVIIYFNSEDEMISTLSMSEKSLETKMVPVYKKCMKTNNLVNDKFKWSNEIILNICDSENESINKAIEFDSRINKIKGFAYCYLTGANNENSLDILKMRRILKDIKILAAGLHGIYKTKFANAENPEHKNTTPQKEIKVRLDELIDKIKQFGKIAKDKLITPAPEPSIEVALTDFGFKESEIIKIIHFLKSYKLDTFLFYELNKRNQQSQPESNKSIEWLEELKSVNEFFIVLFSRSQKKSKNVRAEDLALIFQKTDAVLSELEKAQDKENTKLSIDKAFAFANLNLTTIYETKVKEKEDFYKSIINALFDHPIDSVEDFKAKKSELVHKFGRILRDIVLEMPGKDWAERAERVYLNSLLDNIEKYLPFNLKSHKSEVLQSFAAFIIKGEDPEKLKDFLVSNEISVFRYSYGFWGATFGFAALPKTMSHAILAGDEKYVYDIMKKLYKQIHDYEIKDEIKEEVDKTQDQELKEMKENIEQPQITEQETQNTPEEILREYLTKKTRCKTSELRTHITKQLNIDLKLKDIENLIEEKLLDKWCVKKEKRTSYVVPKEEGFL